MRKKDDTLRETLLACARDIAGESGPDGVNIRAIAKRAGVATGTVYNYFSGKDEILLALTEETWRAVLRELAGVAPAGDFRDGLREVYALLRSRLEDSAGALMRSLTGVAAAGRSRMGSMQALLGRGILDRMDRDPAVRRDIWDARFTREAYARFLLENLVGALRAGKEDIEFLLEVVGRTIY